jgi:pyruvate kinase
MSTMYTANHLGVTAIAALTESGSTALWMSRISSGIPIFALTRQPKTSRRLTLYRGVYPVVLPAIPETHEETNREAIRLLLKEGVVKDGELVIITKGDLNGVSGWYQRPEDRTGRRDRHHSLIPSSHAKSRILSNRIL